MTQKERKSILAEAEKTGKMSLYKDAKIYCNYKEILDTVTNPIEFKKIWEKIPDSSKVFFIQQSMRFVLKEKGKETEGSEDDVKNSSANYRELEKIVEKLNK